MANPEHLEILKQGVETWNTWRQQNLGARLDLTDADLSGANLSDGELSGVDLSRVNLCGAFLSGATLSSAKLISADLRGAYLNGAHLNDAIFHKTNLNKAHLNGASLIGAHLWYVDLIKADLTGANLKNADLTGANLAKSYLGGANLVRTQLKDCSLAEAICVDTTFASIDLSGVKELESTQHTGPSNLSTSTIQRSQGKIPEVFLRGCGLSDLDIEYAKLYSPELSNQEIDELLYKLHDLRAQQPLQISPLFISYSHTDTGFVERLEGLLVRGGIRFWRDVHHATAGRLEKQIDKAIRQNPTVLVILSKNSIISDWVEHEVRTARGLEKETGRDVLCPIALDDSWKTSTWPKRVMEQVKEYNILDFSRWNDNNELKKQFRKLIDGLNIFYE